MLRRLYQSLALIFGKCLDLTQTLSQKKTLGTTFLKRRRNTATWPIARRTILVSIQVISTKSKKICSPPSTLVSMWNKISESVKSITSLIGSVTSAVSNKWSLSSLRSFLVHSAPLWSQFWRQSQSTSIYHLGDDLKKIVTAYALLTSWNLKSSPSLPLGDSLAFRSSFWYSAAASAVKRDVKIACGNY